MPEGNVDDDRNMDNGEPTEDEDDDDDTPQCSTPSDLYRSKTEDLGDVNSK